MRGLRASTETVVVTPGGRASGKERLHAPDSDGRPQCQTDRDGARQWVEKDRDVFPPGYRELCSRCFPETGESNA